MRIWGGGDTGGEGYFIRTVEDRMKWDVILWHYAVGHNAPSAKCAAYEARYSSMGACR